MAPGIYERQSGVYDLVVSLGKGPGGQYRQRTRTFRGTLAEAKKARVRLLGGIDASAAGQSSGSMTFAQLLDRHIERVATAGSSPHTVADYRGIARNHLVPALGTTRIDRLRTIDFDTLYDHLATAKRLRPASVRKVHTLARGALRQAVRWGLVQVNVAAAAAPPVIRHAEIRVPSPQEVQTLIASAHEPWTTLLRVAVGTGMRRGELVALRWSDIDLEGGTVCVRAGLIVTDGGVIEKATKTDRVRVLSIGASTVDALRSHRQRVETITGCVGGRMTKDTFVFASSRPGSTEATRPDSVTAMFDRLRSECGLGHLRFHSLRHFHATQLVAAGVDVRTVAGRLGHASPAVTLSVYSAFLPVRDRDAAALIDRIIQG